MNGQVLISQYAEGIRYFSAVNLIEEDLKGLDLIGINLSKALLRRSKLSKVNSSQSNLMGADLRDADLSGADLIEANLSGADLRGANLNGADLTDANLAAANLLGVKGRFQYEGAFFCKTISPDGEVIDESD
jgi:uncharacterized protein YjbI with pentapeptide repeats